MIAITRDADPGSELAFLALGASEVVTAERMGDELAPALLRALARSRGIERGRGDRHRYDDTVRMIRDGIYESDEQGAFTFANPALAEILGVENPEGLLGRHFFEFLHESQVATLRAAYQSTIESGIGHDVIRVTAVREDGSERHLEIRPTPITRAGRVVGSMGIVRDLTAEVQATRDLKLLVRAIETSPTLVLIVDSRGRVVYVNPQWCESSGVRADEVVDKSPAELRAALGDHSMFEGVWEAVLRKEPWRGRATHVVDPGRVLVIDTVVTPLYGETGEIEHFVSVGIDVTEIAKLNQRLATVDKWQAIGQFAGGIAHDLNNHLGVVLANTEIALGRGEDDVAGRLDDLDGVLSAAASAKRLVQAVLASSRRSRIKPIAASPGEEIRAVAGSLEAILPEGLHLEIDVEPGVPIVALDRDAFRQILVQLVTNARDAMRDGGVIELVVRPFFADADFHGRHPWCPRGAYAEVRVTDRGVGMDSATRARAMEMFFTTKGPEGGSGLGLPVAFGLLKQHDGFMILDSEAGRGTVVQLLFPVLESLPQPVVSAGTALRSRDHGRIALYVEDNDRLRRAGRRALEGDGFQVIEASDGQDALEKYETHAGRIDIVISDLVMPRLGGADLYRRLVERYGPVPFIITSGHVDDDPEHRDHLPADVPYLLKPWGVDELTEAVDQVLRGRPT